MVKLKCGNLLTPHRVYSEFFFNLNPSLHAVKEPGSQEGSNVVSVEDQGAISLLKCGNGRGFLPVAPLGNVPHVGHCDCPVCPGAFGGRSDATEGTQGVLAGIVGGIPEHLGGESALVSPPRVGMCARGMAAFHGHGAGVMNHTLQGGSGGIDGSQSEEILDGPQGG